MLHNVLCNNAYLIKWTEDNGDNCTLCRTIENSKHLSFDCKNVENIWKKLRHFLSIDLKRKHIDFDFYLEKSTRLNL